MGCVLSSSVQTQGRAAAAAAGTHPSRSNPGGHTADYRADGSGSGSGSGGGGGGQRNGHTAAGGGGGGGGGGGKFDWASGSDGRTSNVYDVAAPAAVTSVVTAKTSPPSQGFPQKGPTTAPSDAGRAAATVAAPNLLAPMVAVVKPARRLSGVALAMHGQHGSNHHGTPPANTATRKAHGGPSQLSPTKISRSGGGGAHGSHAPLLHSPMRHHPHGPNLRASMSASAELHHTRESLLSDISDTLSSMSSTVHSSQGCNSPSYGNGGEGRNSIANAIFRAGDDLEAQRQQAPLSIEEDLFVYDDIVISKDEARTKHWRLAGRKPPPVAMDGTGGEGGASGGAGGGGGDGAGGGPGTGGKKFFSFNDFDVCVDEMDLMPLTAAAAAGVAALQREALAEVNKSGLKFMTVTNTASKTPNTVAYLTAQARATQPKVNRPLRWFQATPLLGHANRVKCIALSPAETDFASCSNEDASITLNNLGVGSEVGIFTGHQDTIINATFSPDGKYLATTSKDKTMILWDVMTTKNLLTFSHPKVVICCCFGPDSKYLVSGCQDRVCRLWDTKRGREWLSYTGHEGIIIAIAFSPDGNYVCSASADKSLRVWSATTAKTRFHLLGHMGIILSCSYTSDGRHIISNDESLLRVWSAEDGNCKLSLSPADVAGAMPPQHRGPKLGWTLSSAAPGAFTRLLLVACNNRFVYVLDIETGREVTSAFCKAPVYCLTAGSYEKMACGDSFGNIYILSLK